MKFKVIPCGADKIPLIKDWQTQASDNPEQIRIWSELFKTKLAYFGVPTGPINNLLVLDVDVKKANGFDSLKDLPIPDTVSQQTRSGGAHFFFQYPKDGKHYGNKAGFKPSLDIRGVGGYIIYYGTDLSKPIAEAPSWLLGDHSRPQLSIVSGPTIQLVPEIAQGIIRGSLDAIRTAAEGESNNVLNTESFRIGQLVASGSITREFAEAELFKAAKERGKPDFEAKATIKSGLDGGMSKPLTSPFTDAIPSIDIPAPPIQTRWTPDRLTKYDLLNTSKLRKPQLFEDWSTEDISITTADGGTGKTTLKLFEAICLALGERFLGFQCKQRGKTLFITGEDTDKKLAALLGSILRQMGLFEEGIENEQKIQTVLDSIVIKKDSDLTFIQKDKQGFLQPNPEALRKVLEAVEDVKPKMIVIDPIASFWGSESALNDMAKAVAKFTGALADKSNACVEMINHMGKQSSQNKDMTQFAGRGGTGLPSHARVSRVLRSLSEEEYRDMTGEDLEDDKSAMLCNVNKFSDGSKLFNKPFIIVREGYLFRKKDLTAAKVKEVEKSFSDIERVFTFIKQEREAGRYPTKPVVIAYFMDFADPISKARIERSLTALQYTGHLGEKVKAVEHIDATVRDKMFVLTDKDGKEI